MVEISEFIKHLPKVLEELDTVQKLIGLVILTLPVVLIIGIRDMMQPWKGMLTVGSFFGVVIFLYIMLEPAAKEAAEVSNTSRTNLAAKARQTSIASGSGFIFPDSGERLLKSSDLEPLDKETLAIARNEIYARRGLIFKKTKWKDYFSKLEWYQPHTTGPTLNTIEVENIALIKNWEAK